MDVEKNKTLVRTYAEAFSRGDLDAVCRCFAPGAVVWGVLGWGDLGKVRPIWEQLVESFRMKLSIEALAAEGNFVASRFAETGEFLTAFRGTNPTGRTYEVVAMEWFELGEAGIEKRWGGS